MPNKNHKPVYVLPFSRLRLKDVPLVGGKNAALGEMFNKLKAQKIPVPDGFAISVDSYWEFVDGAGIRKLIKDTLKDLDPDNSAEVARRGQLIREAFLKAEIPIKVQKAIVKAYGELGRRTSYVLRPTSGAGDAGRRTSDVGRVELDIAVRSSATAEDLPGASFAGQQESYLHIKGEAQLIEAVRKCFASLFTDRAIVYRTLQGFNHMKVALSVGVQRMVRSDIGASGVMFTIHTETGFKDVAIINASYGLGEAVVKGMVNPDQYLVHKPTLAQGFESIIERRLGNKEIKIIYNPRRTSYVLRPTSGAANAGRATSDARRIEGITEVVKVKAVDRTKWVLDNDEVVKLAKWGSEIEKYFSREAGHHKPMDIEWAKDGKTGELFIVQARPETVASKRGSMDTRYKMLENAKPILTGVAVGHMIGAGPVHVLKTAREMDSFKKGEVLVARMTDPDWVPVMKQASAIITEAGGRTCHAAIVSRELGIPCVVGAVGAIKALKNGQKVTVNSENGEQGFVYDGILKFEAKTQNLKRPKNLKTKVMLNVGNPDAAFEYASMPVDGVGLARLEFILNQHVKVHPLACLNMKKVSSGVRHEIEKLTVGYKNPRDYFVSVLAEGMAKIGAAFYPRPVIVRLSDFKTNEYANLLGGAAFEPKEENPMIGWRGCSRYYDPAYSQAFALECEAVHMVREKMGLANIKVMLPFCRTVQEAKDVQVEMRKNGLVRGRKGLELYMMVEIPSNVILAEKFAVLFDGFSIGSNDLTQLTLGVDRDSALVRHLYDERNEAVKTLITSVVKIAKKKKVKIGICGQAPSDYPDFAKFLVTLGIDSMSLTPDSAMGVMRYIK